jgi:glycylpeptide N-tetradecanoyltransferase
LHAQVTRRVNLNGTFQAVYTAGVVLPKPVAIARYWHRSLNPKKLIGAREVGRNLTATMQSANFHNCSRE